jgi:hypothetical protein
VDQALRTLEHASRSRPGDVLLARRYRSALRRQLALEPSAAADRLDRLQGVLCFPRSGESGPQGAPAPNRWRRVAAGDPPLLLPDPPAADALTQLWRARGELRYLGAGVALIETPDEALEARAPHDGSLLWRVEPELGPGEDDADEDLWESERREVLGWVVAPWGAARLAAHFEREPQVRRVGRHTARGRVTEREVVGHGDGAVELSLQLALPEPTWVSGPPEELTYTVGTGEPLADSDMVLEDFHDQLLALSLDLASRQLAVRWRDGSQSWAVLLITGDAELSSSAGPAGWEYPAPHDPFAPPGQSAGQAYALTTDVGTLTVVQGANGPELHHTAAQATTGRRRFAGWDLKTHLAGRHLRAVGPADSTKDAALAVADGRLYLQAGLDLSVWGDA